MPERTPPGAASDNGWKTPRAGLAARKQARRVLREQQLLLASVLECLPLGIGVYESRGQLVHSNRRLRDYVGLAHLPSSESPSWQRWRAFDADNQPIPPDHYPGARALRGESVTPGMDFLYEAEGVPGRWVRISAVPFRREGDNANQAILVVQDVDDLKRATEQINAAGAEALHAGEARLRDATELVGLGSTEAAIRASEAQFRSFAANSSSLIWIADPAAGAMIYRSAIYERIWGVPCQEEPTALAEWMKNVHPDDRLQVEHAFATVKGGEIAQFEYRIVRPADGTIRWLRETSFPIPDEFGAVTRIGGITEDFTREEVRQVYIVSGMAAEARKLVSVVRALGYHARSFESGSAFLNLAAVLAPGCVLIDLRKGKDEGLSIPRELKARSMSLPIITLDAPGAGAAAAVAAMKAGAVDYVIVDDEATLPTTLGKAIADCHGAVRPATRDESAGARVARLTPREREVLVGLIDGGTNKIVGQKLGISPRTVELHRAQVMKRLNASSLTELLQVALAAGIRATAQ